MNQAINPTAKLMRYPEKIAAWRQGKPFAPIGVELYLTMRCNLGCNFCAYRFTHSRGPLAKLRQFDTGDEMGEMLAYTILRQLHENDVKSVTFSGGGEPTLHPKFTQIALKAAQMGLKLGLYTNGTRIDKELAAFIKQHFEWAVVSLDAINAEDYHKDKQVDAFEKACEGVRNLAGATGNCKVGVSYLLDGGTYHDMGNYNQTWRMIELTHALGGDYTEFRPIVHFGVDEQNKPTQDTSWISHVLPHLKELNQRSDVHVAVDKFERLFKWNRGYATCHGCMFTGAITPDGKVWVCINRVGMNGSCLGDLTKESYAEICKRAKPFQVDSQCRVLCRADALNVTLDRLATPLKNEEFV